MQIVTAVAFEPKTGELVVTSQDVQVQNNALAAIGQPTVTRVALSAPRVSFDIRTWKASTQAGSTV